MRILHTGINPFLNIHRINIKTLLEKRYGKDGEERRTTPSTTIIQTRFEIIGVGTGRGRKRWWIVVGMGEGSGADVSGGIDGFETGVVG